ncbi:WXG100 family type VII secretion target [Actinacidiphila sp. bgisy167]|uniref:WXG100 family type VII secretion target n=1 Tax=Actinacidiphila sp. bgisy167 TaxID=3413797 RepID=UPI003D72C6A8
MLDRYAGYRPAAEQFRKADNMAQDVGAGTSFQGSDGVLYNMEPSELRAKAQNIRDTEALVQQDLRDLKNYVVGLEASWGGIAATTFQQLMLEWDYHAMQLRDALLGIAGGLTTAAANAEDSEQSNVSNLTNIQLPPARLA